MTVRPTIANTIVRTYLRVLYRPIAGRVKKRRVQLGADGFVTINGGKHTISDDALFTWTGKLPWCIIQQGQIPAVRFNGLAGDFSPEFLDEAVSNHYASDVLRGMEEFGRKQTTEVILICMLGGALLLSMVFGVWSLVKLGAVQDQVIALTLKVAAQAVPGAGHVDGATVHA